MISNTCAVCCIAKTLQLSIGGQVPKAGMGCVRETCCAHWQSLTVLRTENAGRKVRRKSRTWTENVSSSYMQLHAAIASAVQLCSAVGMVMAMFPHQPRHTLNFVLQSSAAGAVIVARVCPDLISSEAANKRAEEQSTTPLRPVLPLTVVARNFTKFSRECAIPQSSPVFMFCRSNPRPMHGVLAAACSGHLSVCSHACRVNCMPATTNNAVSLPWQLAS